MLSRMASVAVLSSTPQPSSLKNHGSLLEIKKPAPLTLQLPASLHRQDVATMELLFRKFDIDGDGKISPAELRSGMTVFVGEEALSPEDAEVAVMSADSDGDGMLGFEDLAKLLGGGGEEENEESCLMEAFKVYEMEGERCITPTSLQRALRRLGETEWSPEDCEVMIRRFDVNGDGVISFDEFKIMMMQGSAASHL